MKKAAAVILAALICFSCVSAESIPVDENIVLVFNSIAKTLGADTIDHDQMVKADNIIGFPCNGYDVLFFLTEDNKVERAGIRLHDDSASGRFILASMTMISALGTMDYGAFGMMLYQYGQVVKGETDILEWKFGRDTFTMSPDDKYKAIFVYLNTDLELFV